MAIYGWRFRAARAERASGGVEPWRAAVFVLGVAALGIALLSPLDELGGQYLFSAHMLQHILIGDLAPLLIILGLSRVILRPATRRLAALERAIGPFANPFVGLVLWLVLLYVWHVPTLYDAALGSPFVHALEHISFLVAGFLLWWPLIQPVPMRRSMKGLTQFTYVIAAKVGFAALGVFFIWSSGVIYDFYAEAPRIMDISALDDQKAGGALMMAEQSIVLFAAFFVLFVRMLARSEEEQLRLDRLDDAAASRPGADVAALS